MYLSGSYGTGNKILNNWESFSFWLINNDGYNFSFRWKFDNKQYGYATIILNDKKIAENSVIDTDNNSSHQFDRPLGLYNDASLKAVFEKMILL